MLPPVAPAEPRSPSSGTLARVRPPPAAVLHVIAALFALVGALALVTSRPQLSSTMDEPNHLAAGLQWWQDGKYDWFTENPPLGRVAVAAVPYWTGMRLPPRAEWDPHRKSTFEAWWVGLDLLHAGAGYEVNLARARAGVFPFYLLVVLAVWGLAGGRRRPLAGLLAVALTATLPPLIANGGLATTDVPFLAMFLLAVLALRRWFDHPLPRRAAWLGAALGAAVLGKFTTLVFFPVVLLALLLARRLGGVPVRPSAPTRTLIAQVALALATAFFVVWAGYRFSWGTIGELPAAAIDWFPVLPAVAERGAITRWLLTLPLPFPELFHGLYFLKGHTDAGHTAFLLGETSRTGFRAFYPVAFAVKAPLPFLVVTLGSLVLVARGRRRPGGWWWAGLALAALAILALSTGNRINLGFRHVMPILPLLAVASAGALAATLNARTLEHRRRLLLAMGLALAVGVQAGATWVARPDLLGWFNQLAGKEPAAVLLDGDNDWGQDLLQLRRELRARDIKSLHLAYFGVAKRCEHDLPAFRPLPPDRPVKGWVAVSENFYRGRNTFTMGPDPCDPRSRYRPSEVPRRPFAWLEAYTPVAMVGSSIRLYYLP